MCISRLPRKKLRLTIADIATHIEQLWYGKSRWAWLLVPLSWLYRLAVKLRRTYYARRQPQPLAAPVIVVGNLTVGGTGKTPLIISMVEYFKEQGMRPGVISRGYGGQSENYPCLLNERSRSREVGDEPLLIARHCPVVVDPQRRRAADYLLAQTDCNLVLSDDGLQHYPLPRDIEIVVVDGARRFGNRHCLPAGPLREPISRLADADLVVINGGPSADIDELAGSQVPRFLSQTEPRGFRSLVSDQPISVSEFPGDQVHAVAGIGNPQRFADTLRDLGFSPQLHAYPDHHSFSGKEFVFSDDLPVIITAKDAVKCRGMASDTVWVLDITASPAPGFFAALTEKLNPLIS